MPAISTTGSASYSTEPESRTLIPKHRNFSLLLTSLTLQYLFCHLLLKNSPLISSHRIVHREFLLHSASLLPTKRNFVGAQKPSRSHHFEMRRTPRGCSDLGRNETCPGSTGFWNSYQMRCGNSVKGPFPFSSRPLAQKVFVAWRKAFADTYLPLLSFSEDAPALPPCMSSSWRVWPGGGGKGTYKYLGSFKRKYFSWHGSIF